MRWYVETLKSSSVLTADTRLVARAPFLAEMPECTITRAFGLSLALSGSEATSLTRRRLVGPRWAPMAQPADFTFLLGDEVARFGKKTGVARNGECGTSWALHNGMERYVSQAEIVARPHHITAQLF